MIALTTPAVYIDRPRYQSSTTLCAMRKVMPDGGGCVSVAGAAGEVTIEVNDTGRGIPLESRLRVQTFFNKADRHGIGAGASKKIIHDHGAEMLVTRRSNGGNHRAGLNRLRATPGGRAC